MQYFLRQICKRSQTVVLFRAILVAYLTISLLFNSFVDIDVASYAKQ